MHLRYNCWPPSWRLTDDFLTGHQWSGTVRFWCQSNFIVLLTVWNSEIWFFLMTNVQNRAVEFYCFLATTVAEALVVEKSKKKFKNNFIVKKKKCSFIILSGDKNILKNDYLFKITNNIISLFWVVAVVENNKKIKKII